VDNEQWTVGNKQWTVKTAGSGQWAVDSEQWTVKNGQFAVSSRQCTVGNNRRQWTLNFGLAIFGSNTKYSLHFFASNENSFSQNSFRMLNLLTRFTAKQANKTIFLYSLRTESMSVAPYWYGITSGGQVTFKK
jgi:hypothetical protein